MNGFPYPCLISDIVGILIHIILYALYEKLNFLAAIRHVTFRLHQNLNLTIIVCVVSPVWPYIHIIEHAGYFGIIPRRIQVIAPFPFSSFFFFNFLPFPGANQIQLWTSILFSGFFLVHFLTVPLLFSRFYDIHLLYILNDFQHSIVVWLEIDTCHFTMLLRRYHDYFYGTQISIS